MNSENELEKMRDHARKNAKKHFHMVEFFFLVILFLRKKKWEEIRNKYGMHFLIAFNFIWLHSENIIRKCIQKINSVFWMHFLNAFFSDCIFPSVFSEFIFLNPLFWMHFFLNAFTACIFWIHFPNAFFWMYFSKRVSWMHILKMMIHFFLNSHSDIIQVTS